MMQKIFNLSDDLHRVLTDQWAVEKRCVPSKNVLENVIKILKDARKDLTINTLSVEDYKLIFQFTVKAHNYELNNTIPDDEELKLIVDTFKFVAKQNAREEACFDSEDLQVLYFMYNILSYQKNKVAYMSKFSCWRA